MNIFTIQETTTEEPTTTTTEEVCPCTDDVTGQIFNGFTPFFAKFGQIKGYASGANTFVFAMGQTIHDAEKNPGMPAGGHDGYIVIRKYNSCDHTVMEKFADPSVTWEMTDFTCGDATPLTKEDTSRTMSQTRRRPSPSVTASIMTVPTPTRRPRSTSTC